MAVGARRGAGAVEDFEYVRFGGPTLPTESYFNVTAAVRILRNNPDRVMVIITNNGPDALYWSLNGNPTFPNVQQLGSGQQEVFQVQNDGSLCSHEIWATTANAQSQISVIEVVRQKA